MSIPSSQPMAVSCKCGHVWAAHFRTNVDVRVWSAHVKTMHCPKCGKGHRALSLGGTLPVAPATVDAARQSYTDRERAAAWRRMGNTGLSSSCIADRMCGLDTTRDYPRDPGDFGRCENLLALYPEWRDRLHEMVSVSPYWAALIPQWTAIAEKCAADSGDGYRFMRSILDPIENADPGVVCLAGGITMRFGR